MESAKQNALGAFRMLFRPVARFLLRAGVTWKELVEIGKTTYVDVASKEFGIRGRPTNVSRVAILTGFTRREVRRLRDLLETDDPTMFDRMNNATRVLSGWYQDAEYTNDAHEPLPLDESGSNPSFESLCAKYSGDVPASTMMKELQHVGAVVKDDDGRLVAKTRFYIPVPTDSAQMLRFGSVLEDIGETIAHNLHRTDRDPSRFERRATNTRVPADLIPEFHEYVEKEGQAFLEKVDAWLSKHEIEGEDPSSSVRLGFGAYLIQQDLDERED